MTAHRALPRAVAIGLVVTIALGLWLRWFLAGVGVLLPDWTSFPFLRHAHSHLGYYAVLVPLAWSAWESTSERATLRPRERMLYAAGTIIATIGFVQSGYGLLGIVGSTIVGALWLVAAWRIARSALSGDDPMVAVLPGTLLSLACIPLIATSLRSNPAFAASAVQSFLTAMLFLVVAPGATLALGLRQPRAWGTVVSGALSAMALGLWPNVAAKIGLGVHALYWIDVARRVPSPALALPWHAAAAGILMVAVGAVPLTHDVAIGAIHFLVLGPFLSALAHRGLAARVPTVAWWWHHLGVALLAGALVWRGGIAPALGTTFGTANAAVVSAIGGTIIVVWWLSALVTGGQRAREASGEAVRIDERELQDHGTRQML